MNFLDALTGSFAQPALENPTGVMMEAAFNDLNLPWRYINCEVAPEQLANAVAGAKAMGWRGFNCSIPHKESVIPLLDRLAPSAEIIQAVNTVRIEGGELIGENTDGRGFVESVRPFVSLNDAKVVMFGAGGAAKAVAVELALAGVAEIVLVNRNYARAQALAAIVNEHTPATAIALPWEGLFEVPTDTHLVINTTSVGLYPNCDAQLPIDFTRLLPHMCVADGIFNPPQTHLLRMAEAQGCTTVSGLGMLVEQGAIAFEYWTGQEPNRAVMKQALAKALNIPLEDSPQLK